jgi:hypothetical protein
VEARYFGDGKPAYISNQCHSGTIHSFGFHYGYAYACKEHLPVAKEYKKQNHYPLPVLARTPADKILADLMVSKGRHRGIERVAFANGKLIVNHTPYSFQIEQPAAHCLSTFEGFDGRNLPGHHAAFSNWD